jgi:tetratricopeptide (TPR) repeat protein
MTDFTSVSIRPPKDWQAFERHSRLLFEKSLGDPGVQSNGRAGQRQQGVDIFGRRGGGNGSLVGVQCKGKDNDYGDAVTAAELKREVEKTKKFKPAIREFILITTAPDDAGIQEAARLLEKKVRAEGRDLSISVWGWGRVQQEINRFPEVLKAFHPDASPFTDQILDATAQARQDSAHIKEMLAASQVRDQANEARGQAIEERLKLLEARLPPAQIPSADTTAVVDAVDKILNDQIDAIRNFIRADRPTTAITMLTSLRDTAWATASPKIRFRILGNLGSARYRLGEYDTAAALLIESHDYNPQDPVSYANKIAGLLIQGKEADARALAKVASAKFPDNADIALQRLQARDRGETVEQIWADLPPELKERTDLVVFRLWALRAANDDRWRDLIGPALATAPEDERLIVMHAESVLDRIFSVDRSALGDASGDVPSQAEIQKAATDLEGVWRRAQSRETPPNVGTAHNAALAYRVLGQNADAIRLLDEILKRPNPAEETKRLRLALYSRKERLEDAVKLAETLADTPQNLIIRAELRSYTSPPDARAMLDKRDAFTSDLEVIGASFVVIDSYLQENDFDAAFAEAERLRDRFPDDPQSYLTIYRVRKAAAESDAESYLDLAVAKLSPSSDFVSRFMVADELAHAEKWDAIVDLLQPYVSPHFDSPSLRMLIGAAANADRREVLKRVLDSLPPQVAELPYYRRSQIAWSIRVQDIKAAETHIRDYLAADPRNLEMQLLLMNALFRLDKVTELRSEAAKPAAAFDGQPLDLVKFAQFKDGFGDWREAYTLAYATLIKHFDEPEVNMAYVALFLRPGHSTDLEISPAFVGEDMAVTLTTQPGQTETFIIEADQALRPTANYVAPTHAIAKALLGRAVGDKITLPDGAEVTITEVKPKVLFALHNVLETFERQFPDTEGLERIKVDSSSTDPLAEIVERLKRRHDTIEDVFQTYESGMFPIACVARMLGQDIVSTFVAIAASGRNIRICEGTQQERDAATAAITRNQRKGCVLDPIALHIVRRLDLDQAVEAVCGPLGTVENTRLRLTQRIYELEQTIDQPDRSMSWSDGQAYRQEVSPEQKQEMLNGLQADRDWLRSHVQELPAQGRGDLPADLKQLIGIIGAGVIDEARAAQGSDRLFICEDQALRLLTGTGLNIPTTWIQPVLLLAKQEGFLSEEKYLKSMLALIDARLEFLSVDHNLLVETLKPTTSLTIPPDFTKVAGRLGGAKADLRSHLRMAAGAILQFWKSRDIPSTLRQAAVGLLLENLCRERSLEDVRIVVGTLLLFNRDMLQDNEFGDYIHGWMRGHFMRL